MIEDLVKKIKENPYVVFIIAVICILIITALIISSKRSENFEDDVIKETFVDTFSNLDNTFSLQSINEKDKEIIEYFPSAEMNVMYSDANGNLATTQDLGLKNLTVSDASRFGGNTAIAADGRLTIAGDMSNGKLNVKNPNGSYSHLGWTDGSNYLRGHTNVDGGATINGGTTINGGASINGGDTNIGGNMVLAGDNSWIFHTPDDGRKTMYVAPINDAKNDWKWGQGFNIDNNGHMNVGGNVNAGGEMTTQSISRGSGDWLRVNNAGSVGRTALYGNLSVNGTQSGHSGLSVGYWDDAGEGNIKASGSITAAGNINANGQISTESNMNVKGDFVFNGDNGWLFHTPDDGRKIMYIAPINDAKNDWKWGEGLRVGNQGNLVVHGKQLSVGANIEPGTLESWMGLHVEHPGDAHIRLRTKGDGGKDTYVINRDGVINFNAGGDHMKLDRSGNLGVAGQVTASSIKLGSLTLSDAGDGSLRISNGNGWVDVGAKNNGWAHIYTDRPKFAFNKVLTDVSGSPYKDYAKYDAENTDNISTGTINASGVVRSDNGIKIKRWNIKPLDDSGYELRHITDGGSLYAMYDNGTWKGI